MQLETNGPTGDVTIFFVGDNNGLVFHNVDIEDLDSSLDLSYSNNWYTLEDDNGCFLRINLSQVQFIRISKKKGSK
jgi:hypothetical protein